jgi:hypothetical protein
MAEVIFCVDFTLLMRVRRSFRLGTVHLAHEVGEVAAPERGGRGCTGCALFIT